MKLLSIWMTSMVTNVIGSAEVYHLDHVAYELSKRAKLTLFVSNSGDETMFDHRDSYSLVFYGNRFLVNGKGIKFFYKDLVLAYTLLVNKLPDLIYVRFPVGFVSSLVLKLKRAHVMVEMNGIQHEEQHGSGLQSKIGAMFFKYLTRINLDTAQHVLCVSAGIRDTLLRDFSYINGLEAKSFVLENGVDTEVFSNKLSDESLDKTGLQKDEKYLFFVGNLAPWFDFPLMIEGFAKIKQHFANMNLKLIIAGDGVERQNIHALITKYNVSNSVQLLGSIKHQLVPYYASLASLCLATYVKGKNGSSMKAKEYLSCGAYVLISDLDDMRWLETERLVTLYSAGDVEDFVTKAIKMLSMFFSAQAEEQGLLSSEDRQKYIHAYHSWAHVADEIVRRGISTN